MPARSSPSGTWTSTSSPQTSRKSSRLATSGMSCRQDIPLVANRLDFRDVWGEEVEVQVPDGDDLAGIHPEDTEAHLPENGVGCDRRARREADGGCPVETCQRRNI